MTHEERQILIVRRIMLWAALCGLFASTYLLIVYVTGGPIVCGIVKGCDVVRNSRWANSFGVPRPLLGVIFYVGIVAILVWRHLYPHFRTRIVYWLSMLAAFVGFVESAFLTFVQMIDIKAYCLWCLGSAVAATIIFVASWWDRVHVFEDHTYLRELKMQFYSFMAAVIVGGILLFFLIMPLRTQAPSPPPVLTPTEEELVKSELYRSGMTFEGPATATVTLVEFIDYQCPSCAAAYPETLKVRDAYKGKIRFGFRHFPLPEHADAPAAALAAVCADRQGHLFDYSDLLIANQKALQLNDLVRYAQKLNMDTAAFKSCLNDDTAKQTVVQDVQDGTRLGVNSTPTFFINTTRIDGLPSAAQMGELIDQEMKK
jgi:protein-disulfide isomerase/uncharacterized membrane protein